MTMAGRPFVFLNACQVGTGSEVLGDYSGIAAAFLNAGASGVIAPLWSVKDDIAKTVALEFYENTFAGASVGESARAARAGFSSPVSPPGDDNAAEDATADGPSATFMAYQYFGHPSLRLNHRPRTREHPQ
jgi:CHAT domain-containing protein